MKTCRFLFLIFACVMPLSFCFETSMISYATNNYYESVIYEAEDALSDGELIDDGYYGKHFSKQAYLIQSGEYVCFNVDFETAGYYCFKVALCNDFAGKIRVDNVDIVSLYQHYGDTTAHTFAERTFMTKGEHIFEFKLFDDQGYCGVDYMSVQLLQKFDAEDYLNVDYNLSNPKATDKAKQLFEFIKSNYGKNIISGQNTTKGYSEDDFRRIKEKTGKLPAIMGLDLQEYSSALKSYQFDSTIGYAMEYGSLGGIITLHWHWIAPTELLLLNSENQPVNVWRGFRVDSVNVDKIKEAMTDKTSAGYKALLSDLDVVALQLKRLADADIPVLFRPLHEASGAWFWWGLSGSEPYIDLWQTMYNKFTYEYHLNNLIWVWNGQNKDWYPGDEYVDIVGEDIYVNAQNYTDHSAKYADVVQYSSSPKIVALSECGVLIDIDKALENKTMWSWFLNWGWIHAIPKSEDQIYATDSNGELIYNTDVTPISPYPIQTELSVWSEVYNHENVLTLEDSPFHSHIDNDTDKNCDVCGQKISSVNQDENSPSQSNKALTWTVVVLALVVFGLLLTTIFLVVKLRGKRKLK